MCLRSIMAVCVMPSTQAITLHCINGDRIVWDSRGNGADNGEIWIRHESVVYTRIKVRPAGVRPFSVKALMLTPLMVREVERNLLLWTRGRAAVMTHRRTTRPMRLLTRLVQAGHEVVVSHVLTILGGPMERMADWGDKRRRPCIVPIKVQTMISGPGVFFSRDSMALGSVENYRCPVPYRIPGEN